MRREVIWRDPTSCANRFPSPLRGGVRGGGSYGHNNSPIRRLAPPSPQGGGKSARRTLSTIAAAAMVSLPVPALAAGGGDVSPFVYQFMVFVIAIFVGYYVVWSVTPALHTPLMSVTNAISSVIVVGALLAAGVALIANGSALAKTFGFLALIMASVNIFGGFLVTQRMLGMYKKKEPKK
jgi:NAD(P) transhydrogenase subunit alpha